MGFATSLIIAATVLLPGQGRISGGWEGLMDKKFLQAVPGRKTTRIGDVSFGYAVIRDQKTFNALKKVAAAKPHHSVHSWDRWSASLDWEQEVVVCVVRTAPTNLLKLASLSTPSKGTIALGLRFSAIEPSYGGHYPVVLYRFTRNRHDKVIVSIDMSDTKPGGEVPLATIDLREAPPSSKF
jgi:hypothetical protein